MNSASIGQAFLLAGGAILTYLWLLNKLAPSQSVSRRRAEYGMRLEYPAAENITDSKQSADERLTMVVIFVHGLGADPSRTWHHGDVCWITDLLPEDLKRKQLQSSVWLFTFNYDSFWVRDSNLTRLTVTAGTLRRALTNGQLATATVVSSLNRGVLFLGTPYRGTPFTRFGIIAASFLTPLDADVDIMRPLVSDSVNLDDLEKKFSRHFHSTRRIYYFETHKMRRYVLGFIPWVREFVVPEQSATLGADDSQRVALGTDHHGLNKFPDNRDSNYQQIALDLLSILSENAHVLPEGPRSQGYWIVPSELKTAFVGRESILQQLMESFTPDTNRGICRRTALVGLGGVGKTQIALEVTFHVRDKYPDCSVFWVPAVERASFESAYREIGQILQIDGITDDKADVISLVKTALSHERSGRWLLVIDNADDLELMFGKEQNDNAVDGPPLVRCIPFSRQGSVLFTTRNRKVAVKLEPLKILNVPSMETIEAQQLLENSLESRSIDSTESTTRLLDLLANFPLAIKQASAFMKENQITISKYLDIYESDDNEMAYLLGREFEDLGSYDKNKNPIATTWIISFHQILKSNELAANYLQIMGFFVEQDIPQSLLPRSGKGETAEAIGTLKAYGFITEREGSGSYDIHRLVQIAVRYWLKGKKEQNKWARKALRQLAHVFPSPTHKNRDQWIRYIPHALNVLKFQTTENTEAEWGLICNMGESFYLLGKYQDAVKLDQQALEIQQKVLGLEHPSTLASMNSLGNALRSQGKYEEAKLVHQQALELREKLLGLQHPDTLTSMNNLANVLCTQGKFGEAEQMLRQTLELREKVLASEHPDILIGMTDLANTLCMQGKYIEAMEIFSQALNVLNAPKLSSKTLGHQYFLILLRGLHNLLLILEYQGKYTENQKGYETAEKIYQPTHQVLLALLGSEHPDTLFSMSDLANILSNLEKYKEAEQTYRRTLELRNKVLGPEHPDTLASMNSLAEILYTQKKYEEAEKIYQQTLELRNKVLGPIHPDTLISMSSLIDILTKQEKDEEAEQIYQQTLELSNKVLDPEHPDTLAGMNSLANILYNQEKYEEAEKIYRQTLKLRNKVLGPEHPDTLVSMNSVSRTLYSQEEYEEAEQMHRQTLELRTKVLGPEHPDTLVSMNNLADTLFNQKKYEEAEQIYRQTLELRTKVLGLEYPDTLVSMNNLADTLFNQKKYEEAEQIHRQTLELRTKVWGPEHPDTLVSMNGVSRTLYKQKEYEEAEQMYRQTLELRTKVLGPEHPDTLVTRSNLAGTLYMQGKYEEAKQIRRQAHHKP